MVSCKHSTHSRKFFEPSGQESNYSIIIICCWDFLFKQSSIWLVDFCVHLWPFFPPPKDGNTFIYDASKCCCKSRAIDLNRLSCLDPWEKILTNTNIIYHQIFQLFADNSIVFSFLCFFFFF